MFGVLDHYIQPRVRRFRV